MNENNDSLLSVLRREPEQFDFLVKLGLGGPAVIAAWAWIATLFLPMLAVAPITLVLVLLFGGMMALLAARLVQSADRWRLSTAEAAFRPLASARRPAPRLEATPVGLARESEPVSAPPMAPPQPGFHEHYFFMRLETEVQDARRDGRQMAVVALDVTVPGRALTPDVIEKVDIELAQIAAQHAKTISRPLSIGETEFLFSLPQEDQESAKAFVSKVVQALGNYWCHFGVAVYPNDATSANSLIERAREKCEESRQDKGHERTPVAALG